MAVMNPVPNERRRRWQRQRENTLPHGAAIELNGHAVPRIDRAFVPGFRPEMTRIVDPASRRNAGFVHEVQLPVGLRYEGRRQRRGDASLNALELTAKIQDLRGCADRTS